MNAIMRMPIVLILVLFFLSCTEKKEESSTTVLKTMYDKYHDKWHKTITFTQTTQHYRDGSILDTATWYEKIFFPAMSLRIDIGKPQSDSGIIFRADSSYYFSGNKVTSALKKENELLFFFGGLYFRPFEQVLTHFAELKYDLSKFHTATWKGRPVYVLGAVTDDEKVNQLWIDKEKLVPVRLFRYTENKFEGVFENHIPLKNGWSETKCSFYVNDKLAQVEIYHDIKTDVPVDISIFNPPSF
jgi:hypothetical protein